MKNIKGHKINIPPEIVEVCWDIYKDRYINIEKILKPFPWIVVQKMYT